MNNLSDIQYAYGLDILKELATKWSISQRQVAIILRDIKTIESKWEWVNMDLFLDLYINNVKG